MQMNSSSSSKLTSSNLYVYCLIWLSINNHRLISDVISMLPTSSAVFSEAYTDTNYDVGTLCGYVKCKHQFIVDVRAD